LVTLFFGSSRVIGEAPQQPWEAEIPGIPHKSTG
jgi:hypothetical protein